MITIPIYRPEVTLYRRDPDGGWSECLGGTLTNTLFRPMADEDASITDESGQRRRVAYGSEPFFQILAPDGSELFGTGKALYLRTPQDKGLDAISALILAKTNGRGLALLRDGLIARPVAPATTPDPFAGVPSRIVRELVAPPIPQKRGKPALQLSLFGEGGGF